LLLEIVESILEKRERERENMVQQEELFRKVDKAFR